MRTIILIVILSIPMLAFGQTRLLTQEPLAKADLSEFAKIGGLSDPRRLIELIQACGIDFAPTDDYLKSLQRAGLNKKVVQALRSARQIPETNEAPNKRFYSQGGDVTKPQPIYKPNPSYTPQGSHDRVQGTIAFWLLIDTQGNVADLQEISRRLGDGMDENSLSTLRTWRFRPATLKGSPVPFRTVAQVSFRTF